MLSQGRFVILRSGSWFGKHGSLIDGVGTTKMVAPKDFDSPDSSALPASAEIMLALPTVQEYTSEVSHLQGNKSSPQDLPPTSTPGSMIIINVNPVKDILGLIREKRDNTPKLLQELASIHQPDQ